MTETANIHGTDGCSLTQVLPDRTFEDDRRALIALRVQHGADSPIGHRCSNLIEQIGNYRKKWATGLGHRNLRDLIDKTMADLDRLTQTAVA